MQRNPSVPFLRVSSVPFHQSLSFFQGDFFPFFGW